jgi:spore germination cell wall hydrolase CwlJ-like protein
MTPYDTGKVKIGLLYTPPPPEHDADACRLQAALLGIKPKRDWDGISIVVFVLAVVLLLFVDNADAATKLQKTYAAQLKCMKDVIYFEARGEGYAGKAAVANVVLNRAKSTAYPRDVCAVVYQNRQFSWTIDKSKHGVRVKHGKDIEAVASLALASLLKDNTGGATHFHTVDILPYWALSLYNTVTIGRHVFYKQSKGKTS